MKTIGIDFKVWQQVMARLQDENDTPENWLDRHLRQEFEMPKPGKTSAPAVAYWGSRGGLIPVGTKLRARYKGVMHEAEVTSKGIVHNGKTYPDVSNAASGIVKIPGRNGWTFFEAQTPGDSRWRPLNTLRS